ncbi:MAG TPA: tetratricopeptide repeat protein [Eudoraea sp.]|nr:tetratricopeptide repeat protein [Eudoraea sp.]
MATYKKRGFKPKNKAEERALNEQSSTTAEVFSTLDESASRSEQWVARNQNYILGVIGVIAVSVLGYLAYNQFILKPKVLSAANEMFYPQQYFDQALNSPAQRDSLYNLALNGAEGKYGFLDIIDEYRGTPAANLGNYYAGMVYLQMQQYDEAIRYLEQFSTSEPMTGPLALGGIGDAFMQLGQPSEALEYYEKAIAHNTNDYTTPRFLYKAGVTAMELDQKSKALQYFQRVKDEFPKSQEAQTIDVFIGMAKSGS